MKKLIIPELIGQVILLLVLLAITTYPVPFTQIMTIDASIVVMSVSIGVLLIASILKTIFKKTSIRFLIILGFVLIGIATWIFFGLPGFFFEIKKMTLPYWMRVSVYSLPAICIEGGLMTLFTVFFEANAEQYSLRERIGIMVVFVIYATLAFSANFLVIGDVLSVAHQLLFSRVIIVFVLLFSIAMYLRKKKII